MTHFASYNTSDPSVSNVIVSTLETGLTITGTSTLSGTAALVPLSVGQELILSANGYTQTWYVSGSVATGSTSIPVYTQTPAYAFPAGTLIVVDDLSSQPPLAAGQVLTIGPLQTDVAQQLTGALFTDQSGTLSIEQSYDAYNPYEASALLASPISSAGGGLASLPVVGLAQPIPAGSTVVLSYGPGGAPQTTFQQSFVVSGSVAAGATSLPINSQTPIDFFPSGTMINIMNFDVQSVETITVTSGGTAQPFGFTASILAPWVMLVYTNGGTPQGTFRIFARTFFQGR